jgi:hypothetical protein
MSLVTEGEKHSSLIQNGINCGQKKFYSAGHWRKGNGTFLTNKFDTGDTLNFFLFLLLRIQIIVSLWNARGPGEGIFTTPHKLCNYRK